MTTSRFRLQSLNGDRWQDAPICTRVFTSREDGERSVAQVKRYYPRLAHRKFRVVEVIMSSTVIEHPAMQEGA